jgi:sialate O-acetylesterase
VRFLIHLAVCSILCTHAFADVKLPAVIGDHMVLQREIEAPVWGWALPREEVRVRAEWGARARAVAGADGRWSDWPGTAR